MALAHRLMDQIILYYVPTPLSDKEKLKFTNDQRRNNTRKSVEKSNSLTPIKFVVFIVFNIIKYIRVRGYINEHIRPISNF